MLICGCGHRHRVLEVAYVSAPQVMLRDHMAAVYNKTGVVKNGDRLEVLEKDRRFARVRTAKGEEGWLEQRYIVPQSVYDGLQKLAQQEHASGERERRTGARSRAPIAFFRRFCGSRTSKSG